MSARTGRGGGGGGGGGVVNQMWTGGGVGDGGGGPKNSQVCADILHGCPLVTNKRLVSLPVKGKFAKTLKSLKIL